MIDLDGFLKQAEAIYESNHRRARCPKCRVVGQFSRDSSAGARRYKCRAPSCNKTMGCKEFYQRYCTRERRGLQVAGEEEESEKEEMQIEHEDKIKQRTSREEQDRDDGKQVADDHIVPQKFKAILGKIGLKRPLGLDPMQDYNESGASSNSSPSSPRQWSDPSGFYRKRIIGPPHPANIGIGVVPEGLTFNHRIPQCIESNDLRYSLQDRVRMLGVAEHMRPAAMKTIESLQPKGHSAPTEMCLVYVNILYPGATEMRSRLRSLQYDTNNIYTISKSWDAVEFLVSKEYESEFVNKCKMCQFEIVDKEKMFPQSASGVAALRKRFGGLIRQSKHPNVQAFFQARLRELGQWAYGAKQDALAYKEEENKVIYLQYLNVRAMSDEKFRSVLAMIKPASIIFCSETWSVDEDARITHPNVIGCSTQALRDRKCRGRDGIMAFAHTDFMHAIKIIKQTQYILAIKVDETVICGIYFPPSLSPESLKFELEKIPINADFVLGDFNVEYGRAVERNRAKEHLQWLLASFTENNGLTRIEPVSIVCKHHGLDHVFASNILNISELKLTEAPFKTDHPLLSMQVGLKNKLSEDTSSERFWISRLKKEHLAKLFCTTFDDTMDETGKEATHIPPGETPSKTNIETLDRTLAAVIQHSLVRSVGSYHPNSSKPQRSTINAKNHTLADITRAIKSSKRELGRTTQLKAKDSNLTPMQEAEQYYTRLFSTAPPVANAAESATESNTAQPKEAQAINAPPQAERALQSDLIITDEDIINAIKAYPGGKAPGIDGLDRRVLMCLLKSRSFTRLLTRLFRWCVACEHTPSRWNTSLIHPIPKPGKDPAFVENRRPVALTAIFRRIFEKILLPHISGNESYDRGQGGFRRGFSCITMILLSEQGRESGLSHRIYLDLESAYDRVNIPKLLVKLKMNSISDKIIALVSSLFMNCSSTIAVNGALSSPTPKTNGLFQGSLLSPDLFNWYINDLASALNVGSAPGLPNCLLFADDILLQTSSIEHGQQMLDDTQAWCIANDMAVNISKCGTFSIDACFKVDDKPIPVVTSYKYLGVPTGKTGIQAAMLMANHLEKARKPFLFVSRSLCSRSWPETAKLTIYKTFVRSIMEYGAPLIILLRKQATTRASKSAFKKGITSLDDLQTECLRWVLKKKKAKKILQSLTATPDINTRFEELTARLLVHLFGMHHTHELRHWLCHPDACQLIHNACTYPVEAPITTTNIRKNFRTQFIAKCKKSSRMAALIDDSCRTDIGIDSCLEIPECTVRNLAVAWRTNTFGLRATCHSCLCPFNRRHVNTCFETLITGKLALSFEQAKNAPLTFLRVYTILDHLLNARRHDLFFREISRLESLMTTHTNLARIRPRGDGEQYPSSDLETIH